MYEIYTERMREIKIQHQNTSSRIRHLIYQYLSGVRRRARGRGVLRKPAHASVLLGTGAQRCQEASEGAWGLAQARICIHSISFCWARATSLGGGVGFDRFFFSFSES
jgi:hypothetical protein